MLMRTILLLVLAAPALAQNPSANVGNLCLRGVNMPSGSFGPVGGVHMATYGYPIPKYDNKFRQYPAFTAMRLQTFRIGFKWERLQPTPFGPLDAAELARIVETVTYYESIGGRVVLDVHNYGKHNGVLVTDRTLATGAGALADFWKRVAVALKNRPNVIFGLMNEPSGLPYLPWVRHVQSVVLALRQAGVKNVLLVPSANWTNAHSWAKAEMTGFKDPLGKTIFEAHQYFDPPSTGTSAELISVDKAIARLQPFTDWLNKHGHKGYLGEFAVPNSPAGLALLEAVLAHMDKNPAYVGWAYWASGPWWPASYHYFVNKDSPQVAVLRKHAC